MARILFFFETDCPACRLAAPYVSRLAAALDGRGVVEGISQDPEEPTAAFVAATGATFAVRWDPEFHLSRKYDPQFVPAFYLLLDDDRILRHSFGFSKADLNDLAAQMGAAPVASPDDGNAAAKPDCSSRHREIGTPEPAVYVQPVTPASKIQIEAHSSAYY